MPTSAVTMYEPTVLTSDEIKNHPEFRALVDRAVRTSRGQYWCDRFQEFAPHMLGIPLNEIVDSDGLSCDGYDTNGFKNGRDRRGFDAEGFNVNGFDKDGYNKDGYDRNGLNREGRDVKGRDAYRFDYDGYDQDGFDSDGYAARRTRTWFANQAAKSETDFIYDNRGNKRPVAKKTVTEAVKNKLGL